MNLSEELERSREFSLGIVGRAPPLNTRRRRKVLTDSDGNLCPTCSCEMEHLEGVCFGDEEPKAATVEHINPTALGGSNEDRNLTVRCNWCNRASGNAMNQWLQRHDYDPPWNERKRMIAYLWLEANYLFSAQLFCPELYDSFISQRESLATKINV